MLLLDPVLHVAAAAIQFFVEGLLGNSLALEVGHHEARIAAAGARELLGLGHHPALAAPGVERPAAQFPEPPRRLPGRRTAAPRLAERLVDALLQAGVARQAEHIIDALPFTPSHDLLPAESRITAYQDLRIRPAVTNLRHYRCQLVHCLGSVGVGAPQAAAQQVLATGDVQREIAVMAVVAMEEPAFLIAVQGVVGRIQIQHHLRRRRLLALQKQIDQKNVDQLAIGDNLLVTNTLRRRWRAELQAVQRAGTGQSVTAVTFAHALRAGHIGTTTGQRQSAVGAQSVMVVEILIARRQRQYPLCDQGLQTMLDPRWIAMVNKTGR